ncbi:hypothetical protein FM036_40800, partial [Nostoc sp. HG1]|nr:hypothetical protein [Nostoc sp. HG1]
MPVPKIEPSESPKSEEPQPVKEPKGGFFNRFRRSTEPAKPSPSSTPEPTPSVLPEPIPSVSPCPSRADEEPCPVRLEEEKPAEIKEAPKEGFLSASVVPKAQNR